MFAFFNGQIIEESATPISLSDRAFLYGDGLFETLRVYRGKPFAWERHFERFAASAAWLKIALPFSSPELLRAALELIQTCGSPEAALRIHLSRGVGGSGYSPIQADRPNLSITLRPLLPVQADIFQQAHLVTASLRLPADDPLGQHKTSNKLRQILAKTEAAKAHADDALFLTTRGEVAETTSSNLFWVENDALCTPPVSIGILPGVTRSIVLELASQELNIPVQEEVAPIERLHQAAGIFLTSSSAEIVEVLSLDGTTVAAAPLTHKLRRAYRDMVLST